jgi:hypothetical protein
MESAHLYNLRLVYDWHRWYGTAALPDTDSFTMPDDRVNLCKKIEELPIPHELIPRLMWGPYLT